MKWSHGCSNSERIGTILKARKIFAFDKFPYSLRKKDSILLVVPSKCFVVLSSARSRESGF